MCLAIALQVIFQVDSGGNLVRHQEAQDTHIDHVAASSSTSYIWSPLLTNWGAYQPVAVEPVDHPVGEDSIGHYVSDSIFEQPVDPKVTGKHVQVQTVEAPGEWPTIEGVSPWLGDRWCPEYPDVYLERGQSDPGKRHIACEPSLLEYQLKPTGWKAYVLKEQEARPKKDAKLKAKLQVEEDARRLEEQAKDEARRLQEQKRQQEEQQQQLRQRWARRVGAKPSNLDNLSYLDSLWPPAGAGKGSIAPGCNAAIEPKRPEVEHRIRSLRRFKGYCNKVSIQSCSSDEDDDVGPWDYALPRTKPMYNKLCMDANGATVVRNIRIDYHAHMADKVVGNVHRRAHDTMMDIYDGQRLGTELSWRIGGDLKGRVPGGDTIMAEIAPFPLHIKIQGSCTLTFVRCIGPLLGT